MEFSVPYALITPAGTISFNPGSGDGYYLENVEGLDGGAVRTSLDDLPQHDGTLLHRFFRSGFQVRLTGRIQANAGNTTRRTSEDVLRGYTARLLRPTATELVSSCRLHWTPSGYSDDRMIDAVQLFEPVVITSHPSYGANVKQFEFVLASPYPYVEDYSQATQAFASGATHTVTNAGNVDVYPVIELTGTFTTPTVTNTTTGETVTFLSGISSPRTAEVDCFRKSIFTDLGVDLLGKIDWTTSVFPRLVPGANSLTFTGVAGSIKWNNGWSG